MAEEDLDKKLLLYVVPYKLEGEDKIYYEGVAAYGKNMAGIAVGKLVRERDGKEVGSIITDEIMCVQQVTDIAGKSYDLKFDPVIKKKRGLLSRIFRRN